MSTDFSIDRNLHKRILAVMSKVSFVAKGDKTVNGQYTFVSHDAVTAAIRGELVNEGITVYPVKLKYLQDGNRTEVKAIFRFTNVDDYRDFIDVEMVGYGVDPQDKGPGKAVSYAFKYALLKTFCLETGDDIERDSIEYAAKRSFDDVVAAPKNKWKK